VRVGNTIKHQNQRLVDALQMSEQSTLVEHLAAPRPLNRRYNSLVSPVDHVIELRTTDQSQRNPLISSQSLESLNPLIPPALLQPE
jgi:hypothetical protein